MGAEEEEEEEHEEDDEEEQDAVDEEEADAGGGTPSADAFVAARASAVPLMGGVVAYGASKAKRFTHVNGRVSSAKNRVATFR